MEERSDHQYLCCNPLDRLRQAVVARFPGYCHSCLEEGCKLEEAEGCCCCCSKVALAEAVIGFRSVAGRCRPFDRVQQEAFREPNPFQRKERDRSCVFSERKGNCKSCQYIATRQGTRVDLREQEEEEQAASDYTAQQYPSTPARPSASVAY